MNKTKKMTDKHTKKEILDEYEKLRQKIEASDTKQEKTEIKINKDKLEACKELSFDTIVKDFAVDKAKVFRLFDSLVDELTQKVALLNNTNEAIELAKKELQDIYGIKNFIKGLETLQQLKDEKEQELQEYKISLDKQKDSLRNMYFEESEKLKKEKERKLEEEEYNFTIKLRDYKDTYETQKKVLQTSLEEIQGNISHYKNLEEELSKLKEEMESKIEQKVSIKEQELQNEYDRQKEMSNLKTQNEKELLNKTIQNQQDRIAELLKVVGELKTENAKIQDDSQKIIKAAIDSSKTPNNFTIKSSDK